MMRRKQWLTKLGVGELLLAWNGTLVLYLAIYGRLVILSVSNIVDGILRYAWTQPDRLGYLLSGMIFAMPPLVVFLCGREYVFNWSAQWFDASHQQNDGAFIAEMLTRFQESIAEMERERSEIWRAEQQEKNRVRIKRIRVLISAIRAQKMKDAIRRQILLERGEAPDDEPRPHAVVVVADEPSAEGR